jgi:hypothetical protein
MKKALAVLAIVAAFGIAFVTSATTAQPSAAASASCIGCLERCAELGYSNAQCLGQICHEECQVRGD